jgi:hypothetical protein
MAMADRSVMPSSSVSTKAICGTTANRQIATNRRGRNGRRNRLIHSREEFALDVLAIGSLVERTEV